MVNVIKILVTFNKSRIPKKINLHTFKQVLIVTDEGTPPYMRTPLSKELWFNEDKEEARDLTFKQWNGKSKSLIYDGMHYCKPESLNAREEGGVAVATGKRVRFSVFN